MKRIQLFEFEDFKWLPKQIRTGATNLIVVLHKLLGTSDVIADLIGNVRMKYDFTQIVDLGSGSGGAMPEVIKRLNENGDKAPVKLILTDLHPNPEFVRQVNDSGLENVSYSPSPLDAINFDEAPPGLKTMMNSFHHIPPEKARKILKSAQDNEEPLLIYEMGENFVPTLLWWILLPVSLIILIVMVLFMTPFVRPLTWRQLVFTYLIPVIPIVYAWDGQASTVRTYTFNDVSHLLRDMRRDDYVWEIAHARKSNGKKLGYYILGLPLEAAFGRGPM